MGFTEQDRAEAVTAHLAGEPAKVVAARLGITPTTVRRWAREAGAPHRRPGPDQHPAFQDVLRAYSVGHPIADIVSAYGVTKQTVLKWVSDTGLPQRNEPRPEWPDDIRDAAITAYINGEPSSSISARLGPSDATITRWVRAAGYKVASVGRPSAADEVKKAAIRDYRTSGQTAAEVGARHGVPASTLTRWAREAAAKTQKKNKNTRRAA